MGGQGGGEGEGVGSLFRYNFRCHPGCCVVIRTLSSALYTYFIRTFGESEPYSHKFTALSPMVHTLQVAHTGELPENHRESEPNFHESVALSPGTEKTGVAAGIYDLRRLTAAKNQALRQAHCGCPFVSGCYHSIAPNIHATSFCSIIAILRYYRYCQNPWSIFLRFSGFRNPNF